MIPDSIKNVARGLADSAMKYYDGDKPGGTPGLLPAAGEFNWWEGGALFGQVSSRLSQDSYQSITDDDSDGGILVLSHPFAIKPFVCPNHQTGTTLETIPITTKRNKRFFSK
jgi:hypothetical protein